MPSVKVITPLLGGGYYHIFNRGVNKQTIFFNPDMFIFWHIVFCQIIFI